MRRHDLTVPLGSALFRTNKPEPPRVRYEGRTKAIHTAPAHRHVHDHMKAVAPMCGGLADWGRVPKHPIDEMLIAEREHMERFMRRTHTPAETNKAVGVARLVKRTGATITLRADGKKVFRKAVR